MSHAYCTYFDSGYLTRGMALIESLRAHGDASPVWIMALDEEVPQSVEALGLADVHVVRVSDLEENVPGLRELRESRSRMEYYFTCTPLLIRHVMRLSDPGTSVAYLDADLWFFSDPRAVFAAMGDGSVGIIEHRYAPRLERRLAKYGRYNVGWVGFADDARGRACLDWWGERTLEWCSDTPQDGRYADQGYLDRFPELFEGVTVLPSLGMDAAPWNSATARWAAAAGQVLVGADPLVFFHFHGVRRVGSWWITAQLLYGAPIGNVIRERVYRPYTRALDAWNARVPNRVRPAARGVGMRGYLFRAQKRALDLVSIVTRNAVRS